MRVAVDEIPSSINHSGTRNVASHGMPDSILRFSYKNVGGGGVKAYKLFKSKITYNFNVA